MFNKVWSLLRRKKLVPGHKSNTTGQETFTGHFAVDEKLLRNIFKSCGDVKYKKLEVPALGFAPVLLVYTEGLTNPDVINRDIVTSLLRGREKVSDVKDLITVGQTTEYSSPREAEPKILGGSVLILQGGKRKAVVLEVTEMNIRAIEEPAQERVVRGPRDGFTESGTVNLSLIRRRLPTASLKVLPMSVGRRSATKVSLLYIEDIADKDLVDEIQERIAAIDIDGILEPGMLSELITERTVTPFPLQLNTERPDKTAAALLQGKVAVVVDGSPFVLLAPCTFAEFYHSPEDYYMGAAFALISRLVRFVSLFIATTFTAAYTAVVAFHFEVIPRDIVIFIAQSREAVPFTPFLEALLLEFAVELVREASIRLPGPIGPIIGIVGALILGQAAVQAQLVSPVLLIIVATSFIANFTIPNYEGALSIRYLRFPILAAAWLLGGFGIVFMWLVIGIHLCNLQSFGIPYMAPIAPLRVSDMGDYVYRRPWRWMRERPGLNAGKNIIRQKGVESKREKR